MTNSQPGPDSRIDCAENLLDVLASHDTVTGHLIAGGFAWPAQQVDSSFDTCRFEACVFAGAELAGTTFADCEFLSCSFRGAELRDAAFIDCDLTTCNFERANAYGLELNRCQAQGADFSSVDFSMTLVRNQTIASFTCSNTNLACADFSSTFLFGASFKATRLTHALMHNCDLSHAKLIDCELDNLEAMNLKLNGANLSGSRFNNLDPGSIDLAGAQIDADQALSLLTALGIEVI